MQIPARCTWYSMYPSNEKDSFISYTEQNFLSRSKKPLSQSSIPIQRRCRTRSTGESSQLSVLRLSKQYSRPDEIRRETFFPALWIHKYFGAASDPCENCLPPQMTRGQGRQFLCPRARKGSFLECVCIRLIFFGLVPT